MSAVIHDLGTPVAAASAAGIDTIAVRRDAADAEIEGHLPAPTAGSIAEAVAGRPGLNVAVVSTPGEDAAPQVRAALELGLHVVCLSSNVPLAEEVALKRMASERGRLLMGPDCGTALIRGVGLGFANAVRRGPIGIVGSSGTAIQALSSLIHEGGSGVSHALGTGSRDADDEVGGLSTLEALAALGNDPDTALIVLVSKRPGGRTRRLIEAAIEEEPKPVVTCFLDETTLEEAAATALGAVGRRLELPAPAPRRNGHRRGELLGLFAGGGLLDEARTVLTRAGVDPTAYELVDMGLDAMTRGRPHPMIDSGPRSERIAAAASDGRIGVLLLDVVLGHAAAPDPAGDLAPAIRAAAGEVLVIASVVGTGGDPQGRARQEAVLREAGATVLPTSARAAGFAAEALP